MTTESAGRTVIAARSQGGRCEVCGRAGTNVHHRMREGRPWNPANLLRVCGAGNASGCHGWIETHPMHAIALGLIVHRQLVELTTPVFCKPALFWRGWWLPDDEGMWHTADQHQTLAVEAALVALYDYLDARRDAE